MSRGYMLAIIMTNSVPYPVSRSTSLPKPRARMEGETGLLVEEPYSVTTVTYDKHSPNPPQRELRTFVKVTVLRKGNHLYFSRTVGDRV